MLPIVNRLRRKQDFDRVWRAGQEGYASGLRVRWAPGCPGVVRVGIIVSKRVHKLATRRNRLRRVIREGIRPLLPRLRPGGDYLLIATSRLAGMTTPDMTGLLERTFVRNRLIKHS